MKATFLVLFILCLSLPSQACFVSSNNKLYPIGEVDGCPVFLETQFYRYSFFDGEEELSIGKPVWAYYSFITTYSADGQEISKEVFQNKKDIFPEEVDGVIRSTYKDAENLLSRRYEEFLSVTLVKRQVGMRDDTEFHFVGEDLSFVLQGHKLWLSKFPDSLYGFSIADEVLQRKETIESTPEYAYNQLVYINTDFSVFETPSFTIKISHYNRGSHYDEEASIRNQSSLHDSVELGESFHHGHGFDLFMLVPKK